jgi:anti-anti-sigma factor
MEIKVSTENGRVPITVVHVDGKIDASTADAFQKEMVKLVENGARHMLIDLTHTPYISSAGLRALHEVFNKLRDKNGDIGDEELRHRISNGTYKSPHLKLLNLSAEAKIAFETAGFDMYLQAFSNRQEAINSF